MTTTKRKPLPAGFLARPRYEAQLRLARWYAAQHDEHAHGMKGGWIYTAAGKPIAQGWGSYYGARRRHIWEALEGRLGQPEK